MSALEHAVFPDSIAVLFDYLPLPAVANLQQTSRRFSAWFAGKFEKADQHLSTELLNRLGSAKDNKLSKQQAYFVHRILGCFFTSDDCVASTHKHVAMGRRSSCVLHVCVERGDGRCDARLRPHRFNASTCEVRLRLMTPRKLAAFLEAAGYTKDECGKFGFRDCVVACSGSDTGDGAWALAIYANSNQPTLGGFTDGQFGGGSASAAAATSPQFLSLCSFHPRCIAIWSVPFIPVHHRE